MKSENRTLVIIVAGVLVVGGLATLAIGAGIFYYSQMAGNLVANLTGTSPSLKPTSPPTASSDALSDVGAYKTENNWIASQIATETANWAWLIVHPNQPVPALKVKATVDPLKKQIHLELVGWDDQPVTADLIAAYAWDPKGYAPFAQQLLVTRKNVGLSENTAPDVLTDLLTPKGEILAQEDVALSKALTQNPSSAELHEKAALVLLTLALRENAGMMSDIRISLNRATAHLAMARALDGGDATSWTGKVANAALLTLSGREVDALPQIEALGQATNAPVSVATWVQALRLLNKQDWRQVTPNQSSPLLLKIAWIQALTMSFYDSAAASHLESLGDLEQVPDWGRALLTAGTSGPAVGIGHQFCESTLGLELLELKSILAVEGESISGAEPLRDVIKNPVGFSVFSNDGAPNTAQVIGPDLFKDITERHVIYEAWRTHQWMKYSWGVPEEDENFRQKIRALFQGERHAHYLDVFLDAPNFNAFPSAVGMHSDVATIPPPFAFKLNWSEPECELLVPYFGWGIPFGDPLNMTERGVVILNAVTSHHHKEPNAPTFRDLIPIFPDSYELSSWAIMLNANQNRPNDEKDERTLLSPFLDYNAFALDYFRQLVSEQSPADNPAIEEILRKQSVLVPDTYYDLGDYLQAHSKPDEAAEAYRQGAQQGADQVLFANKIRTLVEYDFNHGKSDEAEALAKKAADIFSYDGIETYAWLLCKQNRYDEAEDWIRKLDDRYNAHELSKFYILHSDHYPDQAAAEMKKYFPNGLTTVSLADFKNAPKDGCVFQTNSDELQRAGLRAGDVVVALDSHPVHGEEDYSFVRSMSDAPTMNLIIWRDGQYSEVKTSPPNRRFGNQIGDYTP